MEGSNKTYRGSRENQTKEKNRRTTFDVAEKFPEWKTYPQTISSQSIISNIKKNHIVGKLKHQGQIEQF